MVDASKIKSLKQKSKKTIGETMKFKRAMLIVLIAILTVASGFLLYNIYKDMQLQKIKEYELQKKLLEDKKANAKNTINELFKDYPNDKEKLLYISKINSATSSEEIDKILDSAHEYIKLKTYKEEVINSIKNTYGDYYIQSLNAQNAVLKIESAESIDEINSIINSLDIESDLRNTIVKNIERTLSSGDKYYYLKSEKKFVTRDYILRYIKTANINELKDLKIERVAELSAVSVVLSPEQMPEFPKSGNIINIYNKNNGTLITSAIVDSAYLIIKDVKYSESKNVESSVSRYGNEIDKSATSNIDYSLNNLPGVLHATVIGRLDYNDIVNMFGDYGFRLYKLEKETQILDNSIKYLVVIRAPEDSVENLAKEKTENLFISVVKYGGNYE
ncbi:DUF515 domain-containing protein [Methanocaldococcus fervens]|uniref:Uncharacterized protein n=1 Tax=Methanocaldococcus fervens (strain DSM 4213 / JCM 15782 / AG86) TaxID=573064 RepID=C7P861_METFA|nr:DUF515 domain-containing protein [Methanocaldococcus fervens]ACV24743.1 Protein of unknown function DUF515 [Methanocaldococcus fervens AG86]